MLTQQSNEVLTRIKEIATLAGLKSVIDDERECLVTGFMFPDGRSQTVYVRFAGLGGSGKSVVTFFSPCLTLKNGLMSSGLNKDRAVDLLIRNEKMTFGRFGVWRSGKIDMIVVSADQILETMDPEEFMGHTECVAIYADQYEKENGQDKF